MPERIIYSEDHVLHNPPFEIYDGVKDPYAEDPARMTSIVDAIIQAGGVIEPPQQFPDSNLLRVHHPAYIDFLRQRSASLKEGEPFYPSYFILDTYAPMVKGTYDAARASVDVALTGAQAILDGENLVYALCRPPGHHAQNRAMSGYCYFNNASIAADFLSEKGSVAVLDVDLHHGNGTQEAFYERPDVLYSSLHVDPAVKFPYSTGFTDEIGKREGIGFNRNTPLAIGTTDSEYSDALSGEIEYIARFDPKFLVVSLGFDTYDKDPIGAFRLTEPYYRQMGEVIRGLGKPTLLIQEGGYHVEDLGKLAVSFLEGVR